MQGGESSSGILCALPQYSPIKRKGDSKTLRYELVCSPKIPLDLDNDGIFVGYSEVIISEKESDDKTSYTQIRFTNYDNGYGDLSPNYMLNSSFLDYKKHSSRYFERGRTLNISQYDINKNIKYKIENRWMRLGNINTNGIKCLSISSEKDTLYIPEENKLEINTKSKGVAYRYLTYPFVISSSITSKYGEDALPIVSSTKYSYGYSDSLNVTLLKRISTNSSSGDSLITYYSYPHDILNPLEKIGNKGFIGYDEYLKSINEMRIRNLLGIPVEVVNSVKNGLSEKIINATTLFKYMKPMGGGCFYDLVKSYTPRKQEVDYKPMSMLAVQDVTRPSDYNCSIVCDSRLKEVSRKTYNEDGTVKEIVGKNGIVTSFLWNKFKTPIVQASNINANSLTYLIAQNSAIYSSAGPEIKASIATSLVGDAIFKDKLRILYETIDTNPNGVLLSKSSSSGKTVLFRYNNAGEQIYSTDSEGQILSHVSSHVANASTSTECISTFDVKSSYINIDEFGSAQDLLIVKGASIWNASTSDSWMTIEKYGNGLVIRCLQNFGMARRGTLAITSGNEVKTVEVRQDAGTIPPFYYTYDGTYKTYSINLTKYTGWSISCNSDLDWIKNIRNVNGYLQFTLNLFTTTPNNPKVRFMIIPLSYNGVRCEVKITQVANVIDGGVPGDEIIL